MTRRSPARWLAPAALAAAAIAVYVVVNDGEEPSGTAAPPAAETTTSTTGRTTTGRTRTTPRRARTRSYTVRPGDTLSSIAADNDTTIQALQEANPDAESSALTVGDRLRLPAPEGE